MNADGDFVPSVVWETKQTHKTTQPELNGCWKNGRRNYQFFCLLSCYFGGKNVPGKERKLLERGCETMDFFGPNEIHWKKKWNNIEKKFEFSHIFFCHLFWKRVRVRWTKLCCHLGYWMVWILEIFPGAKRLYVFCFVRLVGYFICLPLFGCAWTRRAGSWSTPFYWFCRRG